MTAEEYIRKNGYAKPCYVIIGGKNVINLMVNFTKLHIEKLKNDELQKYKPGTIEYKTIENKWNNILNEIK